jgi:hypothetical protein
MSLLNSASLVVTPNGYKEGTLYSVIPNTSLGDMTVVRATTATRVNSAGLIELVPYNLLQYSEQFDNAYWQKLNGGIGLIPTVTANTATAPDGTLTADRIQLSLNGGTSGSVISYINTSVSTTAATFSIYAKSNTTPCTIYFRSGLTVTTINITTEWQRFELYSSGAITVAQFGLRGGSYGGAVNSNTADISVWGAQLVEGTLPKDYLRTETRLNIPRLDYSNGTCPSLLLEPQRTNLLKYSEQFDNAAWTKSGSSVTPNATTSPDGTINADKLVEDTSTGNHRIVNSAFAVSNGTAYSQSWYVKYFNNQWVQLNRGQEGSGYLNFDLINGVVGNTGGITNYEIFVMPNGWYRISINYVVTGTYATAGISILKTNINARYESYVGDGTSGVYIWGCQYEQSSYPTSYIPTTTASVTRNADVISKTGISSLIGQTEGTMYAEVDLSIQSEAGLFRRILMISNGTETDSTYLRVTSGNIVQFVSFDGTVQTLINSISSISGNVKIAATYKTNEFKLYINGVLQGTDLLGSIPATRSILRVGNSDALISAHNLNDRIELATLFQTALTNDQCIDLTT